MDVRKLEVGRMDLRVGMGGRVGVVVWSTEWWVGGCMGYWMVGGRKCGVLVEGE